MATRKGSMPEGIMRDIEALSIEAKKLPEGPEKEAYKKTIQQMAEIAFQEYDLPAEALAPDAPLVRALQWIPGVSWIPGIARTAVGETALTLAGKNTLEGAKERVANALAPDVPFVGSGPFAQEAPSVGQYRDLMGGTEEWNTQKILPENRFFNPTVGGTFDTGVGMLLDPAVISKGLGLDKKLMTRAPGLPTEAVTSAEAKAALAQRVAQEAGKSMPRRFMEGAKNMTISPSEQLATLLRRSRFKEADKATRAAGKERFSDVFQREGTSGIGQQGIEQGILKTIKEQNSEIQGLARQSLDDDLHTFKLPNGNEQVRRTGAHPRATMSEVIEPLNSPELNAKTMNANTGKVYTEARNDALEAFDREAELKNPTGWENRKALTGKPMFDPVTGEPLLRTTNPSTMAKGYKTVTEPGPTVMRPGEKKVVVTPSTGLRPGFKFKYYNPKNGEELPFEHPMVRKGMAKKVAEPIDIPYEYNKYETVEGTPFSETTTNSRMEPEWQEVPKSTEPMVIPPPKNASAELGNGIEYTLEELGRNATNWGKDAKNAGYYSKPTPFDNERKSSNLKKEAAKADIAETLRARNRELQLRGFDELGLGGTVQNNLSTQASLLEGAPYVKGLKFKGKYSTPTTRTQNSFGSYFNKGNLWSQLEPEGALDATKLGASKLLGSEFGRYGLQPLVRSNINERAADPDRYGPSAWQFIEELRKGNLK